MVEGRGGASRVPEPSRLWHSAPRKNSFSPLEKGDGIEEGIFLEDCPRHCHLIRCWWCHGRRRGGTTTRPLIGPCRPSRSSFFSPLPLKYLPIGPSHDPSAMNNFHGRCTLITFPIWAALSQPILVINLAQDPVSVLSWRQDELLNFRRRSLAWMSPSHTRASEDLVRVQPLLPPPNATFLLVQEACRSELLWPP